MNNKHRNTYKEIFSDPVRSDIIWTDVESMLIAIGAKITEGKGSRIRILLNDERAVFHRPHPEKTTDKGAVKSLRKFLENAGVNYDDI